MNKYEYNTWCCKVLNTTYGVNTWLFIADNLYIGITCLFPMPLCTPISGQVDFPLSVYLSIYLTSQGKNYAATQYSQHCFCGDSYTRYGAADNCNMACGGKPADTCGGAAANQVYEVSKYWA